MSWVRSVLGPKCLDTTVRFGSLLPSPALCYRPEVKEIEQDAACQTHHVMQTVDRRNYVTTFHVAGRLPALIKMAVWLTECMPLSDLHLYLHFAWQKLVDIFMSDKPLFFASVRAGTHDPSLSAVNVGRHFGDRQCLIHGPTLLV